MMESTIHRLFVVFKEGLLSGAATLDEGLQQLASYGVSIIDVCAGETKVQGTIQSRGFASTAFMELHNESNPKQRTDGNTHTIEDVSSVISAAAAAAEGSAGFYYITVMSVKKDQGRFQDRVM